jgi:phosphopantetheinyl transferase (holo-ACP synthase)
MINIIYSPVLEYDEKTAEGFDEARKRKLSAPGLSPVKKNEMYTSGVLIESIRPEGTSVYYKTGGRPEFTKYFDSVTLTSHSCYISFNVTHSGGRVFLAYSDQNDVGVDYEPADREIKDKISSKLCTETEKVIFNGLTDEAQKQEFLLKLFTRKEAVAKLLGLGLAMDFSEVCVIGEKDDWFKMDFIARAIIPEKYLGKKTFKNFIVRTLVSEGGYLSVAYEYDERKLRDRYEISISKY